MNQTTPAPTVKEMPTDLNRVLGHLVTDHGWEAQPPTAEMAQAHRFAHGLDGRPELSDANLTHVHGISAQPQVHHHYAFAPQPRTNGLAIASLVLGITWIWWIGSLLAIIFGIVALRQIGQSNGAQTGRGMAIAGVILGWVGFAFFALMIVMMVAATATSSAGTY